MKVLFLNHNYEGFGTFYRCFYLGKYLSQMGNKIDLICASRNNFDLKLKTKAINKNFGIITLPRIKLHEYHTGHSLRGLINSFLVLAKDYDILHSFAVAQPATAIPTVVAKIFRNKPIIVDWDDAWEGGFAEYHPSLVGKTISYLERKVPKCANKITVVSEFLRQKAMGFGYKEEIIEKIPNGANIDDIQPLDKVESRRKLSVSQKEKIVLSMGHTYMGGLLDFMLEVFRRVIKKEPDTKVYIIGRTGPDHNKLVEKVKLWPEFSDVILFTGEQPFHRIKYYLSAADVLVLSMENSSIERARFPIRLGDYMASGKPIVSNAVGEVRYVIEKEGCGLICKADDPEGFAENILRVLSDSKLQNDLGKRARKSAEETYGWQNIAKSLDKVYSGLLAK